MNIYKMFVDNNNPRSLNYKLRQARLKIFLSQLSNMKKPISILDIGGTVVYWENVFFKLGGLKKEDFSITITNIDEGWLRKGVNSECEDYYNFAIADARHMKQYKDGQFDIVHSNSVIEHVGGFEEQILMANEVRRIGKHHFVQTPSYYFPIEPHFCALMFHWLPRKLRMFIVKSRKMGHLPRADSTEHAAEIVDSAQLMNYAEVAVCFPESIVHREVFLGLTKSFIVTGRGDTN